MGLYAYVTLKSHSKFLYKVGWNIDFIHLNLFYSLLFQLHSVEINTKDQIHKTLTQKEENLLKSKGLQFVDVNLRYSQ